MIIENDMFYAVKHYDGSYKVFFRDSNYLVGEFWYDGNVYCYSQVWDDDLFDKELIALGNLLKEINRK